MGKEEFTPGCNLLDMDELGNFSCSPILKVDGKTWGTAGPIKVRIDENKNILILNDAGADTRVLSSLKKWLRDNTV